MISSGRGNLLDLKSGAELGTDRVQGAPGRLEL